jgi:hypothetical protein
MAGSSTSNAEPLAMPRRLRVLGGPRSRKSRWRKHHQKIGQRRVDGVGGVVADGWPLSSTEQLDGLAFRIGSRQAPTGVRSENGGGVAGVERRRAERGSSTQDRCRAWATSVQGVEKQEPGWNGTAAGSIRTAVEVT